VFAPAWTALYAMLGVSSSLYLRSAGWRWPLKLFAAHYLLNVLWAPVFFGLRRPRLAHCLNFALLASLGALLPPFYGADPRAAYLLLPYGGWLLFATRLSGAVCRLNPTANGRSNISLQADLCELRGVAGRLADGVYEGGLGGEDLEVVRGTLGQLAEVVGGER
jgi:hypothetical protein